MDDETPIDPRVIARRQGDACAASARRAVAVVSLWVVGVLLWRDAAVGRLLLDAGLAVGGWWALRPGERGGGPAFMRADSWTKLLAGRMLVGAALTLGDAWRILSAP